MEGSVLYNARCAVCLRTIGLNGANSDAVCWHDMLQLTGNPWRVKTGLLIFWHLHGVYKGRCLTTHMRALTKILILGTSLLEEVFVVRCCASWIGEGFGHRPAGHAYDVACVGDVTALRGYMNTYLFERLVPCQSRAVPATVPRARRRWSLNDSVPRQSRDSPASPATVPRQSCEPRDSPASPAKVT